VTTFEGGASEPSDTLLPGKAGGAVAVRRTLATTICRVADPTQVARPRQLRDASTVMRFRPAHQSLINRRFDDRASCLARQSPNQLLPMEPRIHTPATWKGGHESGTNHTLDTRFGGPPLDHKRSFAAIGHNGKGCPEAAIAGFHSPSRHVVTGPHELVIPSTTKAGGYRQPAREGGARRHRNRCWRDKAAGRTLGGNKPHWRER
jgi:hypothetical protein